MQETVHSSTVRDVLNGKPAACGAESGPFTKKAEKVTCEPCKKGGKR
jgi:hypothetical protein